MSKSPEQGSFRERVGTDIRNGGIIAGLIGLLISSKVLAVGIVAAIGGEVLRRSSK